MSPKQNIAGPRIRDLRQAKNLSQAMLAARCEVLGWNISENGITKIERQNRCVSDQELLILAAALRVKLRDIFPDKPNLF
jgi:transcriptional regulator with XRE-family HTH domain